MPDNRQICAYCGGIYGEKYALTCSCGQCGEDSTKEECKDCGRLKEPNRICICQIDVSKNPGNNDFESSYPEKIEEKELNVKDTNPKDAVGTKKVPVSVLPMPVLGEVGLALLEGARKYGRHNYRVAGVRGSVYIDACFRHLASWWEGEDVDPDSGLSHITKAIAGLVVLRDSMLMENWKDDRPPKIKDGWVQELNKKAAEIIEKYPNALEPYTELNSKKEN